MLKPIRVRDVSLRNVALKEGERISSVEVEVTPASFRTVQIPLDWSFDVGTPSFGIAMLTGGATHGVGMPFTTEPFRRLISLAFYDYGFPQEPFSIKVKLGLFLYDPKKKTESARLIELPPECILLEEPELVNAVKIPSVSVP